MQGFCQSDKEHIPRVAVADVSLLVQQYLIATFIVVVLRYHYVAEPTEWGRVVCVAVYGHSITLFAPYRAASDGLSCPCDAYSFQKQSSA